MKRTPLCTLIVAALLIPAAVAEANTYDVYSCWAGSGTFRNPNASSAAWAKDSSQTGNRYAIGDDCGVNSSTGSMSIVSLSGYNAANGQFAELAFTTPPGTTLSRARFWRRAWTYGSGSAGASQRNFLFAFADGSPFVSDADGGSDAPYGSRGTGDATAHGIVDSNLMDLNLAPRGASRLTYRVGCGFDAGCPTGDARGPAPNYFASGIEMFGAAVSISDTTPPTVAVAQVGLFDGTSASGLRPVLVQSASDASGIKRLAVFVDGLATPVGVVDYEQDVNRCVWSKPAPCQDVSDIEIPVDTRELPDGTHAVVVKAFDAADNEKTSTTHLVSVKNGAGERPAPAPVGPALPDGAPNGLSAGNESATQSHISPRLTVLFDQNKKTAMKAKYGRMAVVRGRLSDGAGAAIAGAQIDYSALVTKPGAHRQDLGSVRTDNRGEFVLSVATKLGSRQLRFAYRPELGGPIAVTTDAQLDVLAPVSLKAGPKRVRNKHKVTFSGRLGAGPIPRKGKLVNLQVVVDGRWHTFATVRSSKTGRFKYRYRFTRTYSRVIYRFRAVSRYEAAYPFVAGHSKTVRVRVN